MSARLRICLVAASRFPIREPFAGGLEAMTHGLALELMRRGHEVSVFAAPGSDPSLGVEELPVARQLSSEVAREDTHAPPEAWMADHHAYLDLMIDLAETGSRRFDLVHNNSLHHLPVAMARLLDVPVVTTLHTPPVPWLESAIRLDRGASTFTAVSRHAADAWRHVVDATPILNGVDTGAWIPGPGGGHLVWSGRLVPEKAPHQAIDAARVAGVRLLLAGPVSDRAYVEKHVWPRLGPDVQYVGHLEHSGLRELYGGASAVVMSPAWDEPYGLVAAEAMACGTPVASFARGALPEVVVEGTGSLARAGDVSDLARAIREAMACDRSVVRRHAEDCHSLDRMVDDYERLYAHLTDRVAVA